jgi:hypothetical protein
MEAANDTGGVIVAEFLSRPLRELISGMKTRPGAYPDFHRSPPDIIYGL